MHAPDNVLHTLKSEDTYPSETNIFQVRMIPSFFFKNGASMFRTKKVAPLFEEEMESYELGKFCKLSASA